MAKNNNSDSPFDRALPSLIEAEKAILGAVMLDNPSYDVLGQAKARLEPGDFFLDSHRKLYHTYLELEKKNVPISPITLQHSLIKSGEWDIVGGGPFIAALIDGVPRFSNIQAEVGIVLHLACERRTITKNNQIINKLFDQEVDLIEALDESEKEYALIRARLTPPQKYSWLVNAVDDAIQELDDIAAGVSPVRYATGFDALDKALGGGFGNRRLYIVAARTSVGKSTFALQSLINGLKQDRKKVAGLWSLEMSRAELGHRYLHIHTRIPDEVYKEVQFSDEEVETIRVNRDDADNLRLAIFDEPEITPSKLFADALRLKRDVGRLDAVCVDYLSLMRPDGRQENRTREIGAVMRRLKVIAGLLDCPVITPAQIKREAEERGGRLKLTDLRDSDDIALDSDGVLLINTYSEKENVIPIEIDAAKMRNARKFTVKLGFDTTCGRFFTTAKEPGQFKEAKRSFQPAWRKKALPPAPTHPDESEDE